MEALEQPSKRSLLYYVPYWGSLACMVLLSLFIVAPASSVVSLVAGIIGIAISASTVLTFVPLMVGIDSFLTWPTRVLIRPLSVGLIFVFIVLPFFAVLVQTLMSFGR